MIEDETKDHMLYAHFFIFISRILKENKYSLDYRKINNKYQVIMRIDEEQFSQVISRYDFEKLNNIIFKYDHVEYILDLNILMARHIVSFEELKKYGYDGNTVDNNINELINLIKSRTFLLSMQ